MPVAHRTIVWLSVITPPVAVPTMCTVGIDADANVQLEKFTASSVSVHDVKVSEVRVPVTLGVPELLLTSASKNV